MTIILPLTLLTLISFTSPCIKKNVIKIVSLYPKIKLK